MMSAVLKDLNCKEDEIVREIERRLERVLTRVVPPPRTVQADITFSVEASIELADMVVMWVASAITPSLQKELGNLVQITVRRVVNRFLAKASRQSGLRVGPVSVNVEPSPAASIPPTPAPALKTDKGLPHYDDQDVFLISAAEDLVPALSGADWSTSGRNGAAHAS